MEQNDPTLGDYASLTNYNLSDKKSSERCGLLPSELFDQGIQQNPKTTQPINIAPA